ncbi:MAG: adenylate/guanylate cyclase domain-containing protein [Solirubrobacterales bacterium]
METGDRGQGDVEAPEAGEDDGERSHKRMLMAAVKYARELLPGDSRYGDPLSTAGSEPRSLVARRLGELAAERPGILKEAGLSALQVMDAAATGTEKGEVAATRAIVFTDLVGFSSWALEAGDEVAVELLRDVGEAIEPPVVAHAGIVVKRLGDGMMAAFDEAEPALAAVFEARERLASVKAPGYDPRIRAGIHLGAPMRLGDDFFGVDVNVAARVAEEAAADEVLVSGAALDGLDADKVRAKRKLLFRAKGVPGDVAVYSIRQP